MKLIQSKVELIEQEPGLTGIYKQIELAGRTCYKSENNITENSAKEFVDRMIKSKHNAMLEHGTVYLRIPTDSANSYRIYEYKNNRYSTVKVNMDDSSCYYVTTNMRVLVEHDWLDDIKYVCEPTKFHDERLTVRFTCDRGVSHEFVRHRIFCVA